MSLRESKAIDEAKRSLSSFRKGNAFPQKIRKEIYRQIEVNFGIDILRSILISWLPEGEDDIGCTLIDQDGEICHLEIDCRQSELSEIDRYPLSEYMATNKFKQLKPWDDLKIAIDIYQSENG